MKKILLSIFSLFGAMCCVTNVVSAQDAQGPTAQTVPAEKDAAAARTAERKQDGRADTAFMAERPEDRAAYEQARRDVKEAQARQSAERAAKEREAKPLQPR